MTREEFVAQLKAKRQKLGLNLEEIVDATKIPPSAIKKLESGRWEEMNPLYLKGFLKIYCSFLKEDLDEELLKERRPYVPDIPVVKTITRKPRKKNFSLPKISLPQLKITRIPPHIVRGLIAALLVLAMVVVSVLILRGITRFIVNRIRLAKTAQTENFPSLPKEKIAAPAQLSTPVQKEQISVVVTAKRNCFVRVKRENTIVFEGILKKGAVESWQAKKELEFKFSDGTAVDVEVNGQILPPLTRIKKPIKSLKITPTGIFVDK